MGQAAKPAFWAVRVAEKGKAHAYYPSIGIFNCVGGWEKTHEDSQRAKVFLHQAIVHLPVHAQAPT